MTSFDDACKPEAMRDRPFGSRPYVPGMADDQYVNVSDCTKQTLLP